MPKADKPPIIPPHVAQGIAAMLDGRATTITQAAKLAGMSKGAFGEALKRPAIRAFYERETGTALHRAQMRAAAKMVGLIEAPSSKVSFEAAKHVLATAGHGPAERPLAQISIDIKAGYILDLRDPNQEEAPRVIEAKPIAVEVRHELSGPAKAALDRQVPEATSFTPDARWSDGATPGRRNR
jgi:hypothetical protein